MLHKEIIEKLTLEEKASLCSGQDYWTTKKIKKLVPKIVMSDGPHGVRKQNGKADCLGINASENSTCFPSLATLCNSFDIELARKFGETLGKEAMYHNVHLLLGPGVNIKRSPLCGRNFEYFSEDPFLSAYMGKSYIDGLQSTGVGACVKHFAANNQEMRRMTVNSVVDEKTLREIYLAPFEYIVKESNPVAVMSAYNKLNKVYCTENEKLLGILKKEWKHKGIVVTDWGAENDRVKGLVAGNEIEMPDCQGVTDKEIVEAVKSKVLDEKCLDNAVDRIIDVAFKLNKSYKETKVDFEKSHEIAREIEEQSIVLLKNSGILPLDKKENVLIIGELAKKPRYQGGGSSTINPIKISNLVDVYKGADYIRGYNKKENKVNKELLEEAINESKKYNKVIIFAGLTENSESEGVDRTNLDLPENQNKLIEEVCKVNKNVIIVLAGGSPFLMPWIKDVKAVLHGYLGGQAGHEAIYNVLIGKVNPSGKLAETYPLSLEDVPCYKYFPGDMQNSLYKEGIYVGYRYYDKANKNVLFPFGFGLSYTTFEYKNIKVKYVDINNITVKVTVKNTGNMAGSEVIQLYTKYNKKEYRPLKELKGFAKVHLDKGEEKEVEILLNKDSFAYYNTEDKKKSVLSGEYEILVGSSSRDIKLKEKIKIKSEDKNTKVKYLDKYIDADVTNITDSEFETLFEDKLPLVTKSKKFDMNSTIEEAKNTLVGGIVYNYQVNYRMKNFLKNQDTNKAIRIMMQMQKPFRNFCKKKKSKQNYEMVKGFVELLNYNFIEGIKLSIKGRKKIKRR